jgi:hypothetical protein
MGGRVASPTFVGRVEELQVLELAVRLSPSPFEASWPLTSLVELAIWEERYDDARNLVDRAMDVLQPLDPEEASPPTDLARIPAVGLRLEADCAELARTARSSGRVQEARILAKLWVTGRGEAAAVAHRLGLDKQ